MVKKLKIRIKAHVIMKEISTTHSHIKNQTCYMLHSIAIVKYFCTLKLTCQIPGRTKQSPLLTHDSGSRPSSL